MLSVACVNLLFVILRMIYSCRNTSLYLIEVKLFRQPLPAPIIRFKINNHQIVNHACIQKTYYYFQQPISENHQKWIKCDKGNRKQMKLKHSKQKEINFRQEVIPTLFKAARLITLTPNLSALRMACSIWLLIPSRANGRKYYKRNPKKWKLFPALAI